MHKTTPFVLDKTLDFMRLLWTVEHGLQRASKRMQAQLGVTGPQRLVLRVVTRVPGISAGALAAVVQLHPSTLTGILERLVRKDLLARRRDPADQRRVRLYPRPLARPIVRRSAGTIERAIGQTLRRLSTPEVRATRAVLAAVARALAKAAGDRPLA